MNPYGLIPSTAGPLGLFTMETADVLPRRGWSLVGYANKFSRMPGSVTVLNLGFNFGYGVTNWLNLYVNFEPHRHAHVSRPDQLSLRAIDSPLFQTTMYPSLLPALEPAYVEDYPFVANNEGGVGELSFGVKLGLLSQNQGQPFSLSLRNDFIIPTRTSLADLQANGTQSGEFNDLLSLAISRKWGGAITAAGNFGVRFTKDPDAGGTVLMTQADQLRLAAGFILLPESRIQFMNEYTGVVFVGASTPNNSFGARDPVDGVWGVRMFPASNFGVEVGYRYMLNLGGAQDRHGFVIKAGYVHHPAPPPRPNSQPTAACSVNPNSIIAGTPGPLNVSSTVNDPDGDLLTYTWAATGGTVQGTGASVTWTPGNVQPGNYRIDLSVSDGRGGTATCSADVRVDPRPNRPPTASVAGARNAALVGERVGFTATCNDPDGDMLRYTWSANGGQVVGNTAMVQFDTTGLAPGVYTVTVRCEDGRGGAADASARIQVQPAPPPPQATKVNECSFTLNSSRVDNICKRILDDVVVRLQNDPGASVTIIGFADPGERQATNLAGTRASNTADYLANDRGVNRNRINTRPGSGVAGAGAGNRRVDIIWVPMGATF
jgi:outer membrane protein OmpA-like peptidoglycan-associated protein